MKKVYVCDAPFNKKDIDNLSDEKMEELKTEILYFLMDELSKSCPRWGYYEWVMYFVDKASPYEMIEAWNEFNKE